MTRFLYDDPFDFDPHAYVKAADWIHPDDFDPPDIEWFDTTVAGSSHQTQTAINADLRRYRERFGPWVKGTPEQESRSDENPA